MTNSSSAATTNTRISDCAALSPVPPGRWRQIQGYIEVLSEGGRAAPAQWPSSAGGPFGWSALLVPTPSSFAWITRRWRAENRGWQVVRVRYEPLGGAVAAAPGVGEMTDSFVGSTTSWPGMPLGSAPKLPLAASPSTR